MQSILYSQDKVDNRLFKIESISKIFFLCFVSTKSQFVVIFLNIKLPNASRNVDQQQIVVIIKIYKCLIYVNVWKCYLECTKIDFPYEKNYYILLVYIYVKTWTFYYLAILYSHMFLRHLVCFLLIPRIRCQNLLLHKLILHSITLDITIPVELGQTWRAT